MIPTREEWEAVTNTGKYAEVSKRLFAIVSEYNGTKFRKQMIGDWTIPDSVWREFNKRKVRNDRHRFNSVLRKDHRRKLGGPFIIFELRTCLILDWTISWHPWSALREDTYELYDLRLCMTFSKAKEGFTQDEVEEELMIFVLNENYNPFS